MLDKSQKYTIPSKDSIYSGLEIIISTSLQYLALIDDKKHSIISCYFGLGQHKTYSLDEIGLLLNMSREWVRQLINKTIAQVRLFFEHGLDSIKEIKITNEAKKYYADFKKILSANKIHSDFSINSEMKNEGLIFESIKENELKYISSLFDLKIAGQVETKFTDCVIIVNKSLNKKQILDTANALIRSLDKAVLSQTMMDTIIGVRKIKKNAQIDDIDRFCEILPEIELYENVNSKQIQLSFSALSNARDRAFRILHSKGQTMYIDDIVSEVNKKMLESKKNRIYTRHTLGLASDKRFKSKQKTGYWDLFDWKTNTDTIEGIIKKTLILLDCPASYEEIIEKIHTERPNLKETSIKSLIGKNCIKIEGNKFILPEWKNKYNQFALVKKIKRNKKESQKTKKLRNEIIEYILSRSAKKVEGNKLVKEMLLKNLGHTRNRVYIIIKDQSIFKKETKRNGRIEVSLVQNTTNERIDIDILNWQNVKRIIKRELEDRFRDNRQPAYNLAFSDCLDLLKELLDWHSPELLLNGLSERIIPSIEKYYTTSDRTDRLNILKQLVTSLDPILKKILLCVNQTEYNWIKSNRKGLGDVIGKLTRLDPRDNRFERTERTCSVNRWGKEMNLAYGNRNIDTHNAKDWSDTQINSIINAAIVIMIYAVFEYSVEIKININDGT